MAKITFSADAPSDLSSKKFSFGSVEVEVPTETNDPSIIASATEHPWLSVEIEAVKLVNAQHKPTIDPFSAESEGAKAAFDPEAIAAAQEETVIEPVAIDAGKDQDKVGRKSQPVATTVAAAEADVSKTTTGDNA